MIYYKIRSKNNPEMFVKGTPMNHRYTKTGRIFQSIGQLRAFLTYAMGDNVNIGDWEIVELEMVIKNVKNSHEIIDPKKLIQLLSR